MPSCCSCGAPKSAPSGVPAKTDRRATEWTRLAFAALVAGQSMILGLAVNLSPPSPAVRAILHAALAASAVIVFLLVGRGLHGRVLWFGNASPYCTGRAASVTSVPSPTFAVTSHSE